MKKLLIILSVFTVFFVGCQNADDSNITGPVTGDGGIDISSTNETPAPSVADTIDGSQGGTITLACDTTINGKVRTVHVNLHIQKGAFDGVKVITVIASFDSISLSFFPHMIFNDSDLVRLNAHFTGINLNSLAVIHGHDQDTTSSKYSFCYFGNDNSYEIIKEDSISVSNASSQIGVKNAQLKHFSRYCWATRQ
ncbi:MAG: hypothetical protein WB779_05090 [Ignavibacteriaceae bacterium]